MIRRRVIRQADAPAAEVSAATAPIGFTDRGILPMPGRMPGTAQKTGTPPWTSCQLTTWKSFGSMTPAADAYATIASRMATWAL